MSKEERKETSPTDPQILEALFFKGVDTFLKSARKYKASSVQPMRSYEALIAIAETREEKAFAQLIKDAVEKAVSEGKVGATDSAVAEVVSRLLGKP